jgi:Domain of unknown function (DUF397)
MTNCDLSTASWRTSSFSQPNGACVELATDGRTWVAVRDSKDPDGLALVVGLAFLEAIKGIRVG